MKVKHRVFGIEDSSTFGDYNRIKIGKWKCKWI